MYMRFDVRLTVPSECAIGKVKMDAVLLEQRFPYCCYLLALRDGISRNKCGFYSRIVGHHLSRFKIPTCYIVDIASKLFHDCHKVCFLFLRLIRISHKRRVAHDIVELVGCDDLVPIHTQGVAFVDIMIRLER